MSTGVYSEVTREKIKRARPWIPVGLSYGMERFLTRPRDFSVSIVFPLAPRSPSFLYTTVSFYSSCRPVPLSIIERGLRGWVGTEEGEAMLIPRSRLTAEKLVVSVLV